MKNYKYFSKAILISGAVVLLAANSFMSISCSGDDNDSTASLFMLSSMNNDATPSQDSTSADKKDDDIPPATDKDGNNTENPPASDKDGNDTENPPATDQDGNNTENPSPTPDETEPETKPEPEPEPEDPNIVDESSIEWDKTVTFNDNCVSVNDVNLIFQTTSIPDDANKSVEFDGTLHVSYNGTAKIVDISSFTLPFNSTSGATPKGYQLKINLKQIFADASFVSGDVVKVSLKDVTMKTEGVSFVQMVIVDSSQAAGWYKYLSETHEVNIWETSEEPEPEPTPENPNIQIVKTIELTKNEYDASYDNAHTYCGIQAKVPLRTALSDYPNIAVDDTYIVTLKGTSSRDFTAQVVLYDDTETAGYRALSAWGDNANFTTTEFNITKEIVLENVPTSAAAAGKSWDVEKSFSLMIDVPAGSFATADVAPATLSLTEFSVVKKPGESGPAITNWTFVNDFDSSTLADSWAKADWSNNDMFDCWWDPSNITFNESNNGLMKMIISANTNQAHKRDNGAGAVFEYNGAELRTNGTYGKGYYEVKMKPCKASGTNSSFFLYTKDDANHIEWNEIDIEFITRDFNDGRGLRSVPQFNYFVDNAGEGHEFLFSEIAFDSSEDFHVYGIEYAADHISWYVDGTKVYTATGCTVNGHNHATGTLPVHDMQIMVNFWPGRNTNGTNISDWLGEFHYTAPLYAEYDYIKFKAAE